MSSTSSQGPFQPFPPNPAQDGFLEGTSEKPSSRIPPERSRLIWAIVAMLVTALGLASRRFGGILPGFVAAYAGDTLWALLAFLLVGMLRPRWPAARVAVAALLFAFGIEISQLYHAPWIDAIRNTRLGGLILGFGFLWSDLACYSAGIAMGTAGEMVFQSRRHHFWFRNQKDPISRFTDA